MTTEISGCINILIKPILAEDQLRARVVGCTEVLPWGVAAQSVLAGGCCLTPECRTFSHFDAPTVVARLTTAKNHRTVLFMGRVCSWVLQLCKRNVFDDVRKRVVWASIPGRG